MRKVCVTISTLKLCQKWGYRKTRACLLGVAGVGCEIQDRLLNSQSVTEVSSFDFRVECTDRTVQYKLTAQSLRLFGLHRDVNE